MSNKICQQKNTFKNDILIVFINENFRLTDKHLVNN